LNNVDPSFASQIVIAYEPIWAIGTGVSADVQQVNEAHTFIRKVLVEIFGETARNMLILYGGSVHQKNAVSILELDDVNGALVGAASLKADSFLSIIKTAQEVIEG
jgi:triosephosphate isomerase